MTSRSGCGSGCVSRSGPIDAAAELDVLETSVLVELVPPLNLATVATPWRLQVKAARAVLADEARAWSP